MTTPWWGREFQDAQFGETTSEPSSSDGSLNNDVQFKCPDRWPSKLTKNKKNGEAGAKKKSSNGGGPTKSILWDARDCQHGWFKQQLTQDTEEKGIPWTGRTPFVSPRVGQVWEGRLEIDFSKLCWPYERPASGLSCAKTSFA